MGLAMAAIMAAGVMVAAFSAGEDTDPPAQFTSVQDAYRGGLAALTAGDVGEALPALEFAAQGGTLGAQLRLARIYGTPDGPHQNAGKALHYYHLIAKDYADIDRLHPAARHVAEAFRKLAQYYRSGVPAVDFQPNAYKAAQLMRHAASYFRDAEAQFEIGRMYAEGDGVARNQRFAVRWLLKASQKRHAPAQAYLGEMLWEADAGEAMRARGLAFLALAVGNAESDDRSGIERRYLRAGERANTAEIERAERLVAAWGHLRAADASVVLRRLLPEATYAAPAGSMVVPDSEFPSLKELVDALAQQPTSPFLWGAGIGLPEEEAVHAAGAPDLKDANGSPVVRKFLLNQTTDVSDDSTSDVFASMDHAKFGGETLSVSVEAAPQIATGQHTQDTQPTAAETR
jgi:TPR repeat protein